MNNFTEQDLRPYLKRGLEAFRHCYYTSPEFQVAGTAIGIREAKGRFVYPTGSGKTALQSFIMRDMINKDGADVHLVLAPRIVLVNQLMREYRGYIGQSYIALAFHSGKSEPDFERVKWTEESTTDPSVVKSELERAQSMGKDLVVFSTYHSAHRLLDMHFDTLIADESQYCVAENFFDTVRDLNAGVKLFFTATEKHSITGAQRGLNNEEVFGPIIDQEAVSNIIAAGYLVPPRLHVVYGDRTSELNSFVDEAIKIAEYQDHVTRQTMPFSKILFACKGTDDVKTIVEHYQRLKNAMPTHRIFTIVSNAKFGCMIDGVKIARGNFMKELRETDNALVFHYDILSEGIDIDGITGVAIMRNMNQAKLLQTIGRAVRIYKANPKLKTQALVSVPVINYNDETQRFVQDIIIAMRDGGFEINSEDVIFTGKDGAGIHDDEDLEDQYMLEKRKKAQTTVENVFHELEQAEIFNKLLDEDEETSFLRAING
jgi:superfamily II DNA or RNA helicase